HFAIPRHIVWLEVGPPPPGWIGKRTIRDPNQCHSEAKALGTYPWRAGICYPQLSLAGKRDWIRKRMHPMCGELHVGSGSPSCHCLRRPYSDVAIHEVGLVWNSIKVNLHLEPRGISPRGAREGGAKVQFAMRQVAACAGKQSRAEQKIGCLTPGC